jgi:hypothetical protein
MLLSGDGLAGWGEPRFRLPRDNSLSSQASDTDVGVLDDRTPWSDEHESCVVDERRDRHNMGPISLG